MSFANPIFILLFFVFLIMMLLLKKKKRALSYVDYSNLSGFSKNNSSMRLPKILNLLRSLSLLMFVIAAMRPQEGQEMEQVPESGVDIVLAVDTSGSMKALDFEKAGERVNRLNIVKDVLRDFLQKRKGDRISIVTFGETAFTLSPLTSDIDSLKTILGDLEIGMAGEATAIGSAMGVAINRLKDLEAETKIIILLTDGRNNAGKVGPIEMADVAKEIGAKVYTVGIGKVGGKAPFEVDSFFGKRLMYQDVDLDVETLTKIAERTGGEFFNATNMAELNAIYKKIDQLEKREVEIKKFTNYKDLYLPFLIIGIILFLLETILRFSKVRVFP